MKLTILGVIALLLIVSLFEIKTHHKAPVNATTPIRATHEELATKESLLKAINEERAKYNAAPLTEDSRLDQSAQTKACDERDNNYIGHLDKNGVTGSKLAYNNLGQEPGHYDENLTQPTPVTTNQAMFNWNRSKPHHDGIIDKQYTMTGFGICGNQVVEHFFGPY